MSANTLICRNIIKSYSGKEVLHNVNLTLEPNKIYGLIGRNGAGKTSLLSIIAAQNPASHGEILLGTEPVWENQQALDHICFSRELNAASSSGIGAMKVKDYLKTASIYYPHWDKELSDKLLCEFELDEKKRLNKLSKGMLSMITILVAMASKAQYTFLDEPVSGLDVIMREYFYKILLEEYTKTERTFVISTHIIEEASDIFEEVIMMNKGEIMLKENTQELIQRALLVNGRAEEVEAATSGLLKYHEQNNGRSRSVTVLLKKGEKIKEEYDVEVRYMNLQNVFVALCGKEAG